MTRPGSMAVCNESIEIQRLAMKATLGLLARPMVIAVVKNPDSVMLLGVNNGHWNGPAQWRSGKC